MIITYLLNAMLTIIVFTLLLVSVKALVKHKKDKCDLCGMSLSRDHNGLFFGNCVGNADKEWVISDELMKLINKI